MRNQHPLLHTDPNLLGSERAPNRRGSLGGFALGQLLEVNTIGLTFQQRLERGEGKGLRTLHRQGPAPSGELHRRPGGRAELADDDHLGVVPHVGKARRVNPFRTCIGHIEGGAQRLAQSRGRLSRIPGQRLAEGYFDDPAAPGGQGTKKGRVLTAAQRQRVNRCFGKCPNR